MFSSCSTFSSGNLGQSPCLIIEFHSLTKAHSEQLESQKLMKPEKQTQGQPSCCIVLGYRDGQEFIEDQLKSIEKQTFENFTLHIFDDCSTQDLEIIRETSKTSTTPIQLHSRERNVGIASNFLNGLDEVGPDYDFYAFCDQDDIWFSDKLERAITILKGMPSDQPALYCSRTEIVERNGVRKMGLSPLFSRQPSFANALTQNIGGGNTMVMNRLARDLVVKSANNADIIAHDWWAYIITSAAGGNIYYDTQPCLSYRQHGANNVGSNHRWTSKLARLHLLVKGRYRLWAEQNVKALEQNKDLLTDQNQRTLEMFSRGRNASFPIRIFLMRKAGIYRQTLLGNFGLWLSIFLKKL